MGWRRHGGPQRASSSAARRPSTGLVALVLAHGLCAARAQDHEGDPNHSAGSGAEATTQYTTEEISQMFEAQTGIATVASHMVEESLSAEDLLPSDLEMLLSTVIESNPLIFGSAIAFEPGLYEAIMGAGSLRDGVPLIDGQPMTSFTANDLVHGRSIYCPYGHRAGNYTVNTMDLAGAYDYTDLVGFGWYTDPKRLFLQGITPADSACSEEDRKLTRAIDGSAMAPCFWSEVYFDEGAGNIAMSTFSAPFRTKVDMSYLGGTYDGLPSAPDADGLWFGGVVTIDMSLEHISQRSCPADLCSNCPAGKQPDATGGCAPCSGNTFSIFGICKPCRGTAAMDHGLYTQCEPCAGYTRYSEPNSGCVCVPGRYLYGAASDGTVGSGLDKPIVCHESEYDEPSTTAPPGCERCGQCANCSTGSSTPTIRQGYVQLLTGAAQAHVFRCLYDTYDGDTFSICRAVRLANPKSVTIRGCFAEEQIDTATAGCKTCSEETAAQLADAAEGRGITARRRRSSAGRRRSGTYGTQAQRLPLTTACQATYTGHFCSQCIDNYELVELSDPDRHECVLCGGKSSSSTVVVTLVVLGLIIVVAYRRQILHGLASTPAKVVLLQAVVHCLWEPLRKLARGAFALFSRSQRYRC